MKNQFDISIIICTKNRPSNLVNALNTIFIQSVQPFEIIIIDDSEDHETELLIKNEKIYFKSLGVDIQYYKNKISKGLAEARNIGIEKSKGEIVLFLDDDVLLHPFYLKNIVDVYKEKWPNVKGVQGHIIRNKPKGILSSVMYSVAKVFNYSYDEANVCKVLPSTHPIYPLPLNKIIPCQWLSGCNQSYHRSVFNNLLFDEARLKAYSFKEDIDFSYRVWKKYPDQLFITPYAKLFHCESKKSCQKKTLIYMEEIYSLYFFYKNIDKSLKNIIIYIESKLCKLLYLLFAPILPVGNHKSFKNAGYELTYYLWAQFICLKNISKIKNKQLELFNISFDSVKNSKD